MWSLSVFDTETEAKTSPWICPWWVWVVKNFFYGLLLYKNNCKLCSFYVFSSTVQFIVVDLIDWSEDNLYIVSRLLCKSVLPFYIPFYSFYTPQFPHWLQVSCCLLSVDEETNEAWDNTCNSFDNYEELKENIYGKELEQLALNSVQVCLIVH